MSREIVDNLLKQAEQLSAEEKILLAKCLIEQAKPNADTAENTSNVEQINRNQQLEWLKQHQSEYAGQYVALVGDNLVGVGSTYQEAATAARKSGAQKPFITHIPDPNIEYFAGW